MSVVNNKRWSVLVIWLILSLISCFLLARAAVYFRTGANPDEILHVSEFELLKHTPVVSWKDTRIIGRELDEYNRQRIEREYLMAWKTWNLSIYNQADLNLKEHFSKHIRKSILSGIKQTEIVSEQVDVSHNIEPYLFSLDGTLLSFTDSAIEIKYRYLSKEENRVIASGTRVITYDVIMKLEDGHWRIHQLREKVSATADKASARVTPSLELIKNMRGVNYYPAENPWLEFWSGYDSSQVEMDIQHITDLNLNSVRIFIPFEEWGGGNVKMQYIKHLRHFLDACQKADVGVVITLFDFYPSYELEHYPAASKQMKVLMTEFSTHPALIAWDLKNEPDLDFKHHGKEQVVSWLQFIAGKAREWDESTPITIGYAYPENAGVLADSVDFISFHYYRPIKNLPKVIAELRSENPGRVIVMEEFGLSSHNFLLWGNSESDQQAYYSKTLEICDTMNLPFALWTLKDFDEVPGYVAGKRRWIRKSQSKFGVLNTDGTHKPAADVIQEKMQLNE